MEATMDAMKMTAAETADERIAAVRRFNRYYTRQIGVLRKTFLDSPYSLGEARVLYEIASRGAPTASDIARSLDLDPGISAACWAISKDADSSASAPRRRTGGKAI